MDYDYLMLSLNWLWQGWGTLFICMSIIAGATVIINKIFIPKSKKDE